MKMKYCYLALMVFLTFAAAGHAQEDPGAVLDKVSEVLKSYNNVRADFSFTLENKESDIYDEQEGSLVMQGEKYRLSLMGMLAFCDGKTLWIYTEEFNEANILDPDESDFFNPESVFNIYHKDFKLKYLGKMNGLHEVELRPIEENDNYSMIVIKSDPLKNQIKEVFYEGLDGNNYIIKIKSLLTDIQLDDRFFIFDKSKYPGVEVYDLR